MADTLNRTALNSIDTVDWRKFQYSVLVVPGEGPEDSSTPLAELGRKRIALAVREFRQGTAPFILVSGGFVHPTQTRFAEAVEMRSALIRDFGIPAKSILVEHYDEPPKRGARTLLVSHSA